MCVRMWLRHFGGGTAPPRAWATPQGYMCLTRVASWPEVWVPHVYVVLEYSNENQVTPHEYTQYNIRNRNS
eukprot:3781434-Pyramimonas_sp.AAC.1